VGAQRTALQVSGKATPGHGQVDRSEAQNTNVSYFISDEPIDEKEWIKRHVRKH
jgi:hypothetical protein